MTERPLTETCTCLEIAICADNLALMDSICALLGEAQHQPFGDRCVGDRSAFFAVTGEIDCSVVVWIVVVEDDIITEQ